MTPRWRRSPLRKTTHDRITQTEKRQNETECDSNWNQIISDIYLIERSTVLAATDLVGEKPAEEAGNAGNQRGKRWESAVVVIIVGWEMAGGYADDGSGAKLKFVSYSSG